MSDDNPWPPEGTRVRILETVEKGNTGRLIDRFPGQPRKSHVRWVKLDNVGDCDYWPVFRREIEVIE